MSGEAKEPGMKNPKIKIFRGYAPRPARSIRTTAHRTETSARAHIPTRRNPGHPLSGAAPPDRPHLRPPPEPPRGPHDSPASHRHSPQPAYRPQPAAHIAR
ncbi:hypothetical protein Aut01nite_85110 [Actinoplanes utahensis]|nr:hypothetical protein Aut01nite_85110 [Actinoplanes utahensis]